MTISLTSFLIQHAITLALDHLVVRPHDDTTPSGPSDPYEGGLHHQPDPVVVVPVQFVDSLISHGLVPAVHEGVASPLDQYVTTGQVILQEQLSQSNFVHVCWQISNVQLAHF